jgi:hypothetical protein
MNTSTRSSLVVGILLIAAGLLFLADQVFRINITGFTWPLLIIAFGGFFFLGMILGGKSLGGLAVPGSIIAGVGLILLFQNTFNLWETWSYTWALIICFVGIGLLIYGSWSDIPSVKASGWRVLRVGATLFLIFGAIFGLFFSLTGVYGNKASLFWSAVLIGIGLIMLVSGIIRMAAHQEGDFQMPVHLFWPVVFIGVGALWLLVAINVLPSAQALALLNLWPIFLIVGGLNLMVGRRLPLINMAFGLLVVAVLFFFAFAGPAYGLTKLNWYNNPIFHINGGLSLQTIHGSGKTAIEGREVTGFEHIKINSIGSAEIVQGENEGIVIEAEDNLLPYITTGVFAGELVIDVKPGSGIDPTKPITYKITVKNLKEVRTSGAAKVTIKPIKVDNLVIGASGAGDFQLTDLQAGTLSVDISGAGSVKANGSAANTDIRISGTGSINAPDLKTNTASVNISGMGSATLWVTKTLVTHISGAGSINYYGDPAVTQNNSGLGSANRIGSK